MTNLCWNLCTSINIFDTYKSREWQLTSRSARSNRISHHEKLNCNSLDDISLSLNRKELFIQDSLVNRDPQFQCSHQILFLLFQCHFYCYRFCVNHIICTQTLLFTMFTSAPASIKVIVQWPLHT